MNEQMTIRELRTAGFRLKNAKRKGARALAESEKDGNRRYRIARALRRYNCFGGAFGNLDGHDYNEFVFGTSGLPKIDEGEAEG